MPTIYNYLGIIIRFYSNDHEPIHVHAEYSGAIIRVNFFVKNDEIYRVTYETLAGTFNNAKLVDLKKFISKNKSTILYAWKQYYENSITFAPIIVTHKQK